MKTISLINHYCNRLVYFAVDDDYSTKGKSIEQVYKDSFLASFDRQSVSHFAITNNLKFI